MQCNYIHTYENITYLAQLVSLFPIYFLPFFKFYAFVQTLFSVWNALTYLIHVIIHTSVYLQLFYKVLCRPLIKMTLLSVFQGYFLCSIISVHIYTFFPILTHVIYIYIYIYKLNCKCIQHSHILPLLSHHPIKHYAYQLRVARYAIRCIYQLLPSNICGGSVVKNLPATTGDIGLIPGQGRSPGEGNGNPLQYSCLENSRDRGALWATVPGIAKSWT